MECLPQQGRRADLQRGKAVGVACLGKDGKNAVVKRIIRQQEGAGRGNDGGDETPEAAKRRWNQRNEGICQCIGHAGVCEQAGKNTGGKDQNDDQSSG